MMIASGKDIMQKILRKFGLALLVAGTGVLLVPAPARAQISIGNGGNILVGVAAAAAARLPARSRKAAPARPPPRERISNLGGWMLTHLCGCASLWKLSYEQPVAADTSISAPAITASTINICSGTSGNGAAYVCNTSPTVNVQTGTIISFVADTASDANATLTANGGSPVPIYLTPSIPIAAFTFHSGDVVPLQFYLQGGTTPMWLVIGGYSVTGYLPLSGGTLTGALNGTSASFTGTVAAGDYDTNDYRIERCFVKWGSCSPVADITQ